MKVAIYGQKYKEETKPYLTKLLKHLKKKGIKVVFEFHYYYQLKEHIDEKDSFETFLNHEDLPADTKYFITIGGDGTILRAITYVRDSNIPIIGINTGRLGFLSTIQKYEIKNAIDRLLSEEYRIIERSVLSLRLTPEVLDAEDFQYAINEITVSRKNTTSMITVNTYLDDEFLTSYWADGLIIATPTGSTSYSMSCGGPILMPQAKNIVLTPIAPHNLNTRPLIIPNDTKIKLTVNGHENLFLISLDSRVTTINNQTEIYIEKAPFTIKTIEMEGQSFFKTLRSKLLWGEDTRN
ncbi:NAD kinase [Aureivirga sp. CE67]|uniref:NAD kinase n=1 Tax=Aureivirga sp. CE67 TaxID=1788983 RepID=UPI0018C927B4|nr:NAD kinase [Aureivirga sp. CE67]